MGHTQKYIEHVLAFGEQHPDFMDCYAQNAKQRLEQLRATLQAGDISYGELAELASLKRYINDDDVELLEPAGVPEFDCEVCGTYRCREDHDDTINPATGDTAFPIPQE